MSNIDIAPKSHSYCVNPHENEGQRISLVTYFESSPLGLLDVARQELRIRNWRNTTIIDLGKYETFLPWKLREIADQLEQLLKPE